MDENYIQKGLDQALYHLCEEAGEVIAAAGKTLRFGLDSYNPKLPEDQRITNKVWLYNEIYDLEKAIHRLKLEMMQN